MKKPALIPLFLLLCLAVTGCGGSDSISGEVVAVRQAPAALILEISDDKRVAVLVEEDTYIFGMDEIDGDAYKAAPHTGVSVSFFPTGHRTSLTTADGETLKAYRTDRYISIDAYLVEDAAMLSDGTVLDTWKSRHLWNRRYQSQDGAELLLEDTPSGPENHYVVGLENFDDLSKTAKAAVRKYYEEQGALYDLQAELEKAWAAYQADPESFSAQCVWQTTSPAGSNERIMYFTTTVTLPLGGNIVEDRSICAAFDRETGAYIPLADLFACPEADIAGTLLTLAAENGSGPDDSALIREMQAAFRLEYVDISAHGLDITFPQGTLPSQEYGYLVSVDLDHLSGFLHPWAIPDAPST